MKNDNNRNHNSNNRRSSSGLKGKRSGGGIEHRSSGWALGGNKRAVRGLSAKEVERKAIKASRREARELAAMSSGLSVNAAADKLGIYEEDNDAYSTYDDDEVEYEY